MNENFNLFVNNTIKELNNYDSIFRKYTLCKVLFLLKSNKFIINDKTTNLDETTNLSVKLLYETYLKFLSKLPHNLFKIKKQIELNKNLASSLLKNLELEKNKHLQALLTIIEPIFMSIKEKSSNKQNLTDDEGNNVDESVKEFLKLFDNFYASEYNREMKIINAIICHLKKLFI